MRLRVMVSRHSVFYSPLIATLAGYFEGHSRDALAAGIRRYQEIGTWERGVEIPRELYEQALNVFQAEVAVGRRHPYEEVCLAGL